MGTLCRPFWKIFYLFIQYWHFVRGICLAEVKHKISQWNGVGITFYSRQFFSKACPDMIYGDLTILQIRKVATTLLHMVTLLCCHNVVDMFSYNVLRQRCGNAHETFHNLWKRCCSYILLAGYHPWPVAAQKLQLKGNEHRMDMSWEAGVLGSDVLG